MKLQEDRTLFAQIAHGDEEAFRILYHRYNAVLSGTVRKLLRSETETAEVLQEVFLKVWLLRDTLETIEHPAGWLYRLTANYCLSVLRQHARNKQRHTDITEDITDQQDFSEKFYARELQQLMKVAVAQLPPSRKEIFLLSMQEGKSRREIALALDISEHTVKNQLLTARRFIRAYLEQQTGTSLPAVLITLFLGFFQH